MALLTPEDKARINAAPKNKKVALLKKALAAGMRRNGFKKPRTLNSAKLANKGGKTGSSAGGKGGG